MKAPRRAAAVERFTQDGQSLGAGVDADLVGPPCDRLGLEPGAALLTAEDAKVRFGLLAASAGLARSPNDGHTNVTRGSRRGKRSPFRVSTTSGGRAPATR